MVWGSAFASLTLTQIEESLSIWQLSVMKKHFWTLWACLVYLLCLWVALSSVFSPNWILCTHSHRRICISSYTWRIYLAHTHGTFAFMCLLLLCIMTARALPSHLFAFPLNPPSVWGLSLNIKRSTRRKRCGSILNENKPSKTVLQTLCSKAISAVPKFHPIKAELKTRGRTYNYCTSNKLTINAWY